MRNFVHMNHILFHNPDVILSCHFNSVTIHTDQSFVDVEFSLNSKTLISERFFPNDSQQVTLTDLRSLVESEFLLAEDSIATFTLSVSQDGEDEVSLGINILCCRAYTELDDASSFLLNRFISPARSRRVAPDDLLLLSFITLGKERLDYYIYARYLDSEGFIKSTSFLAGNVNCWSSDIPSQNIIAHDVSSVADRVGQLAGQAITLLQFTLRCGSRSVDCFVDRSLAASRRFLFRNAFNAVEMLTLPGVTTAKSKVERKEADILGETSLYSLTPSKEYEMQSAGLTDDECLLCEQMFSSPQVRIESKEYGRDSDFFAHIPILITDSTCEVSDGTDSVNSVKFTWRYPAKRPHADLHVADSIYSDQFTIQYT